LKRTAASSRRGEGQRDRTSATGLLAQAAPLAHRLRLVSGDRWGAATVWSVTYPALPHSHVVPAGYLRPWAHGPQIAMRLIDRERSVPAGVLDVGVRTNFYRRERPKTGEKIYDTEWSMQQAENAALKIVRSLASRWPLSNEDKPCVAQLFGLQHVRGPAFKAWHEEYNRPKVDALRNDPVGTTVPTPGVSPEEAAAKGAQHYTSDTFRLVQMLKNARSVAVAFGSMHGRS
jgi:hypothetical protein